MKIAHLLRSVYHGLMPSFIGSVAMIAQELVIHQRKLGNEVDVLGESDFLDGNNLRVDFLKKYDIICCHETDWEKYFFSSPLKYAQMNYDSFCGKDRKNHITLSNYWKRKSGGRPRVAFVGLSPERTKFKNKKGDGLLYLSTLARKKGCLEILKNIGDNKIKVMGGIHTQDYYEEIKNFCENKDNIELYGRHTSEEEKWDEISNAKCIVMAHFPKFSEESGCIPQIEAKFAGTPVVGVGEIFGDMIINGVTGFVLKSVKEIPKYLDKCKEIDPYCCLEDGISKYTAKMMAELHLEYYQDIIDGMEW